MNEETHSELNILIPSIVNRVSLDGKIGQTLLLLLMYLCDWHSCVKYERRFLSTGWRVSRQGIADDGMETYIRAHADKYTVDDVNGIVICKMHTNEVSISEWELNVINRVIQLYKERQQSGLETFAMSTYPVLSASSDVFVSVDLLEVAKAYRQARDV